MRLFRNSLRSALALAAFSLLSVSPVFAQQAPRPAPRPDYGWVSFSSGATFGSETKTAATFAGEWGEDIIPGVQARVTVEYFDNLMPTALSDDLAALSSALTSISGTPWELRGRDRGVTLIGGARYLFNSQGTIQPYVGGGGGVINLKRTIADVRAGDVTSSVLTEFGVGQFSVTGQTVNRPVIEGAAGVAFFAGHVYADLGYRYKRAFHLEETIDFSHLVAGVGYRF
jgi:opacity protein-like surface antigen